MSLPSSKIRTRSASRITLDSAQSQTDNQPSISASLTRSCRIKIEDNEYDIDYDSLKNDIHNGELLGRGYYGTVKKIKHADSGGVFALKIVDDKKIDAIDSRNSDIMDLKVLLAMRECEHVPRFFGAFAAEGCVFIITELMDTSLDRFCSKALEIDPNIPECFYSKVSNAVLSTLCFMEKNSLIHRDIKPSNILINKKGEIKICDFGISGYTDVNSIARTFKGTERYSSPEKFKSNGTGYTIKSDIWSLGITIIEIATGVHPIPITTSFAGLGNIFESENFELDAQIFSQEMCNFVEKCVIKLESERPSCSELLEHEFIKKYQNMPIDLSFIENVIDKVKDSSK